MKLSILLVTYNQQNYINQCLQSIFLQEIPFDSEIVVADDCSADATLSIIEKTLEDNGCKYRLLGNEENLGISKNYQRGFLACKGEYIAVIEGDDYWEDPLRLKKHITFLDDNPKCVLSFNRLKIYFENKDLIKTQKWIHPDDVEIITTNMMALVNRIGNLSACVFRKSALQKLKPDLYDLGIADWMLGMALGEHGFLARFKEPMSVYRIHDKGKWSSKSRKEQVAGLINITIPKYDKYLGFRYHAEFEEQKRNLELNLKHDATLKRKIVRNTPSFLRSALSFILPKFVKEKIIKFI